MLILNAFQLRLRRRGMESGCGFLWRGWSVVLMLCAILCCGLCLFSSAAGFTCFADFFVTLFQLIQLFIGKFLDIDEIVIGRMMRADEFIQLWHVRQLFSLRHARQ